MEPKELIERIKRKEERRRKRERRIILITAIFFCLTLYTEINFSGLGQKLPFINSILFFALMNVNIILIGILIFLVFRNVVKLFWERTHKVLGARLKTKLVLVFVGFTLIPTVILFTVSAFYINNSFSRWFQFKITDALQQAVDVHADYYQSLREKGFHFGEKISQQISKQKLLAHRQQSNLKQLVHDLQSHYDLDSIEIFSNLEGLGFSMVRADLEERHFPPLEQQFLKEGFLGRQASLVQHLKRGDLIRCVLPIYDSSGKDVVSALVISSFVPESIASKVSLIRSTFNEYREVKPLKRSLKTIYITILLLMTILIIFAAIWFGFHLARELTTPIQYLVEATEAVAQGNLNTKLDYKGNDELSLLVRSFNKMTQDLKESQDRLATAQRVSAWREVARRIAHEIKNPLTPIKLSAQRLRRKYLSHHPDPVFDECTKMIITQVDELKDLVNEFSSFAKLPETHPRLCRLEDIIKEAVSLFQEAHKKIQFVIHNPHELPLMELDREQMKRGLINIIDNAIAAMEGAGKIMISTRYNSTLQFVVIEIADNGPGIPSDIRSHLFEPYFSTKQGGTGLGLAIVKKIVTDHQGYIRVSPNHPRGTKFVIELPTPENQPKLHYKEQTDARPHFSR